MGVEPIESFGSTEFPEPEPINVNQELLIQNFSWRFNILARSGKIC